VGQYRDACRHPLLRLCLGIDIGGSGARAAVGRPDGTVLRLSSGTRLQDVLDGLGEARWVVHVGLAGISRAGRRLGVSRRLESLLPGADVVLTSDAEVALWGALPNGEGVAVVAGTGSIALARAADGRHARAGGHGALLGDDGSGFWIGREAVRAALAAAERRGPATRLQLALAPAPALATAPARRLTARGLASLAPRVSQAAADGDEVAQAILAEAGQALADLAVAAARRVWPDGPPAGLAVATCGGVWQAGALVHDPFRASLAKHLRAAKIVPPAMPPVGGALLLATRRANPAGPDPAEPIASSLLAQA
jgi:N-acetylglucosamine kinase-like BadF-type ATPase